MWVQVPPPAPEHPSEISLSYAVSKGFFLYIHGLQYPLPYPLLFLTPFRLARVLQKLEKSGVDSNLYCIVIIIQSVTINSEGIHLGGVSDKVLDHALRERFDDADKGMTEAVWSDFGDSLVFTVSF